MFRWFWIMIKIMIKWRVKNKPCYIIGYLTGSVYNSTLLQTRGFPGEFIHDGRVIVIKTHFGGGRNWTHIHKQPDYKKAVILMRSPYDCLKALFNLRKAGKMGVAADDPLLSDGIRNHILYYNCFIHYIYSSFEVIKLGIVIIVTCLHV